MNLLNIFSDMESLARAMAATYTVGNVESMYGENEETNFWLSKLDEHLHVISHEMVSEIMFRLQTTREIYRLLEFKKKYADFSNQETEMILTAISETQLLSMLKKGDASPMDTLKRVKQMKEEWNQLFQNQDYPKVIANLKK